MVLISQSTNKHNTRVQKPPITKSHLPSGSIHPSLVWFSGVSFSLEFGFLFLEFGFSPLGGLTTFKLKKHSNVHEKPPSQPQNGDFPQQIVQNVHLSISFAMFIDTFMSQNTIPRSIMA